MPPKSNKQKAAIKRWATRRAAAIVPDIAGALGLPYEPLVDAVLAHGAEDIRILPRRKHRPYPNLTSSPPFNYSLF
jgi:hypothetical protein